MIFQTLLAILLPEKHSIGQTGANHTFVAFLDHFRLGTVNVGNGDEVVHQLAFAIHQVEVLLVFLHGEDQRLMGYFQVFLLEARSNGHRPLDQRGHFVE